MTRMVWPAVGPSACTTRCAVMIGMPAQAPTSKPASIGRFTGTRGIECDVLRGRAEPAAELGLIHPDLFADALRIDALSHGLDHTRAVAVGMNSRR